MRFTLEIECDNDAFEPSPKMEIARILCATVKRIKSGADSGPLFDENGNKVGKWGIEP